MKTKKKATKGERLFRHLEKRIEELECELNNTECLVQMTERKCRQAEVLVVKNDGKTWDILTIINAVLKIKYPTSTEYRTCGECGSGQTRTTQPEPEECRFLLLLKEKLLNTLDGRIVRES